MVYIAANASNTRVISVFFKEREIAGLTACKPSEIALVGVPHEKELAYDGYKSNIDIFISATSRNMKLNTDAEGARLNLERPTMNPTLNPVYYVPNMELTNDQKDLFLQRTAAMAPVAKVTGKTWGVTFNLPSISKAHSLNISCIDHLNLPSGTMGPASLVAAEYMCHIVTEFLSTQTYPAWRTENSRRSQKDIEELLGIKAMVSQMTTTRTITKTQYVTEPPKKRTRQTASVERMEQEEDGKEAAEMDIDEEITENEAVFSRLEESVFVAKPSPLPYTYNIGGPHDVPDSPGLAFPYFTRMMLPDDISVRGIISSFFLRCLGDSREEQKKVFKEIRKGLRDFIMTPAGAELAHVFIGIRLALETQTRLFVVLVNGGYAGFALLGAKFSVLVDDVWYDALGREALAAEVALMSSHSRALESLCGRLSKMVLRADEGSVKVVMPEEVSTGFILWEELRKRKIPDEEKTAMEKDLRMIAYGLPYRQINSESIAWALDLITNVEKPLPSDMPLYVPVAFNLLEDRTLKILCYFGPDSFSFINKSGTKFDVTPLSRERDPNDEIPEGSKGKRKMEYVIVAIKGVLTAHTDMQKFLREKAVTMDMKERAGQNRCIIFKDKGRDVVYSALRRAVTTRSDLEKDVAGEKRKRKREDDKVAPKDVGSFFGLFE